MSLWRSLRLSQKLGITFLILGLGPLLIVAMLAYQSAQHTLEESANQSLEAVAFNAIDKVDRNLYERYGDVQAWAATDVAKSMDATRLSQYMDTLTATYRPNYKLMMVADKNGRIIATSRINPNSRPLPDVGNLIGRNVSDQAWFKQSVSPDLRPDTAVVEDLRRDDALTPLYGADNGGNLAVSFSAPIKDSSGNVIGVWTNRFNWDVVTTIARDVEARSRIEGGKTVRLGLASKDGFQLVDPHDADVLVEKTTDAVGLERMSTVDTTGSNHALGKGLDDKQKAIVAWATGRGFSTYPGLEWNAVATQDYSEALSQAHALRNIIALITLAAAAVIAFGAWALARTISIPVRKLRDVADKVSMGEDVEIDIDTDGKDEIADLAVAFKRMMVSLRFAMQRRKAEQHDGDSMVA